MCSSSSQTSDKQSKPRYELADVFRLYLDDYLKEHKLSPFQNKVVDAILKCRTSDCGGHILHCPDCDYQRPEYDSCRNRHCPKCQISNKLRWVGDRLKELLPVPYYHTVVTMPHSLNTLALYNKEVIYDIFFQAAGHTLNAFARDKKFLGAKPGFIGMLHTWGQTLSHHVHLHFIVAGGGLSEDSNEWVNLPYSKKFLFPAKGVSKRLRRRFAELLRKAYYEGKLTFPDDLAHLEHAPTFEAFVNKVAWENWNSYVKAPFASPKEVVKYIGRYTHRVAISNYRILDISGGEVTFSYKKYEDGKTSRETMCLKAEEFIRRFLLHVIPHGFKRIRHFGFLSTGQKTTALELARSLLDKTYEKYLQAQEAFQDWFEDTAQKCPNCEHGTLKLLKRIPPWRWVQMGYG